MRRKLLFLAPAAIAAFMCGCATPAAVKSPLTVELYDMRPRPQAAAPVAPVETPKVMPGTGAVGTADASAIVEVSIAIGASLPASDRTAPALGLPQIPGASAVVEVVDRTSGQKPMPRGVLRLAIPDVPAASTQKPPAKPPSSPAISQPAAAPRPAASSAPPPAEKSSAASENSRVREIYARHGDEVQIGLEGKAFIFLGFPESPAQAGGMSFKGKETKDSKSYFTFKALRIGTYDLGFLQQDNTTGKSVRETVRVSVVGDAEFTAAIGSATSAPASAMAPASLFNPGAAGDYLHAERLATLGERHAALEEFLKGYTDGNGYLNDRIASLYLAGGDLDAAEKYFAKNLVMTGRWAESGVLGMVRVALVRGDARGLLAQLKPFLAIQELSIEGELIHAARLEQRTGATGVGLELLSEYVKRYPDGRFRDEADWIAGQLYEAESPMRDIVRARDIYRGLLRAYPESSFAERARERVRYIEEHFITVR